MYKVSETDNVGIFSLSRSAWGLLMKVEYFPTKNWYIPERNMELFEDRVQPCHRKIFKCQAFGWLRTLYTRLAKNVKFEILGCAEALEGCK